MWLWQLLILNMLLCFRLLHLRLNEHVVMLIAIEDALKLLVIVRSISSLGTSSWTYCQVFYWVFKLGQPLFLQIQVEIQLFRCFQFGRTFSWQRTIMCLDSSFSVFDLRGWILLPESKVAVKFYVLIWLRRLRKKERHDHCWALPNLTKRNESLSWEK